MIDLKRWTLTVTMALVAVVNAQELGPRMVVATRGTLAPIRITAASAHVRLHGCAVETSLTMRFYNPNNRRLAGMLYCPLPDGAVICGYALDVNGKMVDGVVVERRKARQIFEKEVRKRVDPGLVEAVKGNTFKTRVYPIPAKGYRTVTVRYLSEVDLVNGEPRFTLPLNFKRKLGTFKLKIEIAEGTVAPKVMSGPANITFKKWQRVIVAEETYRNLALTEDLVIALPKVDRKEVSLETSGNDLFALIDVTPKVNPSTGGMVRWEQITIFWDASKSRQGAGFNLEFGLLRELFEKHKGHPFTVNLVLFRNTVEPVETIRIENGNAEPLILRLKRVVYDGGTQIGVLKQLAKQDFCMLFSDGISNVGLEDPSANLTAP